MYMNNDNFTITNDILKKISKIDEFKGKWKYHFYTAKKSILNDLEKQTIHQDLFFIGRSKIVLDNVYENLCDDMLKKQDQIISESEIKKIHKVLFIKDEMLNAGHYKYFSNHIKDQGENIMDTKPAYITQKEMDKLFLWLYNNTKMHPILLVATFCIKFLQISPFQNGNQAIAQTIVKVMLYRFGYDYFKYQSFYFSKYNYHYALKVANSNNINVFINFIIDMINRSDNLESNLQSKSQQLDIKETNITERKIKKHITCNQTTTISKLYNDTMINKNTLKKYLAAMIKKGDLTMHGKGKNTWYCAS